MGYLEIKKSAFRFEIELRAVVLAKFYRSDLAGSVEHSAYQQLYTIFRGHQSKKDPLRQKLWPRMRRNSALKTNFSIFAIMTS